MAMMRFELRIEEDLVGQIDEWATEQGNVGRSEAARRLIERGLGGDRRSVHFSDGERALIVMMGELFKHIGITENETNAHFLAEVIHGGHFWAPRWEMQGVFHDHVDSPREVSHVVNVLDTWHFMESAYERFSPEQKAEVEKETQRSDVAFPGFDGNNESSQMGIAHFLIEEMGRWSRFKGRELNSHFPTQSRYARMVELFLPMRKDIGPGAGLGPKQVIELMNVR